MLGCRLNWRRAGRLERAKECRGIKREQKGREGASRLSVARASLSSCRPSFSRGARDRDTRPPSAVLVYLSSSREVSVSLSLARVPCLLLLLLLDESPNFSSHTGVYPLFILSLAYHRRAHSAATLSLSRLEAGERNDEKGARTRAKDRDRPRENRGPGKEA